MIQLDNVTKFYGERLIFHDVTFKIVDGEKVGIVGKNGAEPFDAGTISIIRSKDRG